MSNVTIRDTKAVILAAYNGLKKDNRELRSELRKKAAAPKVTKAPARAAKAPVAAPISAASPAAIIAGLNTMHEGVAEAMGGLQGDLSAEAGRLEALRARAEALTERLSQLHQLTPDEGTLDALIAQYNALQTAFDQEMSAAQEAHGEQLEAAHAAWLKEQGLRNRETSERDASRARAVKREAEQHRYAQQRTRSLDTLRWQQSMETARAELTAFEQQTRAAWAARDAELETQEMSLVELEDTVAGFDDTLTGALTAAKEHGRNIARKKARADAELLGKERQGTLDSVTLRIEELEQQREHNEARLLVMGEQLTEARKQAQALAMKAIEGAASEQSMSAIREIAMEQAKNSGKVK